MIKKNIQHIICLVVLTSLCIFIMTGCWNNKDLSNISFATAIGIDLLDDGQTEVSVQALKPSSTMTTQDEGGSEKNNVWVSSASGKTVFDAIRNLTSSIKSKLFISHLQLIIISDRFARHGISDCVDLFERDHESNRRAYVIISKNISAKKIINAKSNEDSIPTNHLKGIINNNNASAKIKKLSLIELLQDLYREGDIATISAIELKNQNITDKKLNIDDLKINTIGYFNNDKLIGWLNTNETEGYLFADDKVKSTIINIRNPKNPAYYISIEIIRSKTKKEIDIEKNKPSFTINVQAFGNIGEQHGYQKITDNKDIEILQNEAEQEIKHKINDALKVSQKSDCDILGIGNEIHIKDYKLWKSIRNNWPDLYSKTPYEIKVTLDLKGSGLIKEQMQPR